jgi:hypothetical protein
MKLNKGVLAAAVLLACPAGGDTPARGEDAFTAAEAEAKAGADTPEGKKFAEAVGAAFGREQSAAFSRCAKETKHPDLSNFELLLRVDAAGNVDQALAKPATNLAECVRAAVKSWKVGAPPRPGVWVKVAVNLKKK